MHMSWSWQLVLLLLLVLPGINATKAGNPKNLERKTPPCILYSLNLKKQLFYYRIKRCLCVI